MVSKKVSLLNYNKLTTKQQEEVDQVIHTFRQEKLTYKQVIECIKEQMGVLIK